MKLFEKINRVTGGKRGETLIEVIIAIFIVAVGSGAATNLIVSALQANNFSRDNLIALNLAVEGVEAMRNIRDNNWLRFSYDKEGCWNMMPEAVCATGGAPIGENSYTVDLDPGNYYQWGLTNLGGNILDLSDPVISNNDRFRLSFIDVDPVTNSDGLNGTTDDPDLYVSKTIYDAAANKVTETKFYRMVSVDYPTDDPVTDDKMIVTSVVQWKTGAAVHEVRFSSYLTNYQKIKK